MLELPISMIMARNVVVIAGIVSSLDLLRHLHEALCGSRNSSPGELVEVVS